MAGRHSTRVMQKHNGTVKRTMFFEPADELAVTRDLRIFRFVSPVHDLHVVSHNSNQAPRREFAVRRAKQRTADPGDIFSNLKMAAMLYLEARTEKWTISSDLVYMRLSNELTPGTLISSGTAGVKQLIWEIAGFYRILPFWEVGLGGRYNYISTELDVWRNIYPEGTEEITGLHDDFWFDPVFITRLSTDIKDKWLFLFRGDVGGFGLGSDLTWQLQAYAGYRFGKLFDLSVGFRAISTDYNKETEFTEFVFDLKEFGPVIRFGFNF